MLARRLPESRDQALPIRTCHSSTLSARSWTGILITKSKSGARTVIHSVRYRASTKPAPELRNVPLLVAGKE
jgi:hypothetical protein